MSNSINEDGWTPPKIPDDLSQEKADRLIKWILDLEDENNKRAQKRDDKYMARQIANHIQSEAKCL